MSVAIQKAAETLVDRARQGDQNALGMLGEIKRNRVRNPQAKLAFDAALRYAQRKPKPKTSLFGNCERCTSYVGLETARNAKGTRYGKTIVKFVLDMGQSTEDSRIAADIIAHIRTIDRHALRQVVQQVPDVVREKFGLGYRNPHAAGTIVRRQGLSEGEAKCLQIGYIMGLALRTQQVVNDEIDVDTAIAQYSPSVGWELGI